MIEYPKPLMAQGEKRMAATEVAAVEKKPFHESILDTIKNLKSTSSVEELELVEALLVATKIPKGHDEIIAAMTEKTREVAHENIKAEVLVSILEQKELARVAAAEKATKAS
jgi:hypothetical protein